MSTTPSPLRQRVLIVDDDRVFHEYLAALCHRADFDVAGQATSAEEGIIAARELEPDLILLDLRLPHFSSGLEVAATLRAERQPCKLVLFSSCAPEAIVRSMVHYRIDGYLTKGLPPNHILRHLKAIAAGACLWSTDVQPYVIPRWESELSTRALSTLRCIAHGCSIEECAQILGGSPNAHRKRRERIQEVIGLRGHQLVQFCREKGFDLLPLDPSRN